MRGEFKVELCGDEYGLRADFAALSTMEELGRPVFDMLIALSNKDYRLNDITNILYCCMKSFYGNAFPLTYPDVGALITTEGIEQVAATAAECIATLCKGNDSDEKKRVGMEAREKMKKLKQVIL